MSHLGHLGGHLEQSWRICFRIERLEALTDAFWGTPAGRAEAHWRVLLGKEPKPKPIGSSTPGTPVINQQGAADLMAFGPSRHRAWVVGLRPLGCSLGSRGRPLGGLLEAVLKPLGAVLEPLLGLLAASWGLLEASWTLVGGLGVLSGRRARKGSSRPPPLGPLLGPS